VDLKAPDVANDVTITLPNESGPFATEAYADAAGGLVAVKSALFTGTQTNSTAAGATFAVTNLSLTHTMAASSNKLLLISSIGLVGNSSDFANVGAFFADGAAAIGIGDAEGSRSRVGAGGSRVTASGSDLVAVPIHLSLIYEPGDTAAHTFTVNLLNFHESTQTVYVNRNENDVDAIANRPRTACTFILLEVKA
jgi:hypothetical protein